MEPAEALDRLADARVGHFATVTPPQQPHIVPVTFTVVGSALVHMVDNKPKSTVDLRRLANLRVNAQACLLVDGYDEDWSLLWWVRVDGMGRVFEVGPEWDLARAALADKYPQYEETPPEGPAIYLSIDSVRSWAYTD